MAWNDHDAGKRAANRSYADHRDSRRSRTPRGRTLPRRLFMRFKYPARPGDLDFLRAASPSYVQRLNTLGEMGVADAHALFCSA